MVLARALILSLALTGTAYSKASQNTARDNPDATLFFKNVIDVILPKAINQYASFVAKLPRANATPEDVDALYHETNTYYQEYLQGVGSAISYVGVEILRNAPTAQMAAATALNSTSKFRALLPQLQQALTRVSNFEDQVVAQGEPGHAAIYQVFDYLAYSSWYIARRSVSDQITKGKPSSLEDVLAEFYEAAEGVRVRYFEKGYPQQPRN